MSSLRESLEEYSNEKVREQIEKDKNYQKLITQYDIQRLEGMIYKLAELLDTEKK